jgi:hypothetical protein
MAGSVSCFFMKYANGMQYHPIIFKNQNIQGWGDFQWYNIHPKLHEDGSTVQKGSHTQIKPRFPFNQKKCP